MKKTIAKGLAVLALFACVSLGDDVSVADATDAAVQAQAQMMHPESEHEREHGERNNEGKIKVQAVSSSVYASR